MKLRLDEIEASPLPHPKPKSIKGLKFAESPLASSVAIELDHAGKTYGNKVLFSNFCKTICKGDRTVVTGPNGCGKTTLLKAIAEISEDAYLNETSFPIVKNNYVVISGCSGGGKSSLLTELAKRGYQVVLEPGRQIVKEQSVIEGDALPWVNLEKFLELALSRVSRRHYPIDGECCKVFL